MNAMRCDAITLRFVVGNDRFHGRLINCPSYGIQDVKFDEITRATGRRFIVRH